MTPFTTSHPQQQQQQYKNQRFPSVGTTMTHVVPSSHETGPSGALELLPELPILHHKRRLTNYNRNRNNNNNNSTHRHHHHITTDDMDPTQYIPDHHNNNNHQWYLGQEVYRLHFSIIDKHRSWMRGTKRSIRWVFGLSNLKSLREGSVGRECRGEEHAVEIVRNKTSGKIRIYWNNNEISRYFRPRHFPTDSTQRTVEYSWTTRSDEVLRIVGSIDDKLSVDSIQFDLFIDGVNFKDLCTVAQLGRKFEGSLDQRSPVNETGSQRSLDSSLATNDVDADQNSDLEQCFRLSMFGFNSMTSTEDEMNDELHSDRYSHSLTSLRQQIVSCLPQIEELVSRAIIKACFMESQASDWTYSFGSMDGMDGSQIEVDYIVDAMCWLQRNVTPGADGVDLSFLQRCVDNIFRFIHSEQLNSDEAARIVLSVASVLGLEFALPVASDTIILDKLPLGTSRTDLYRILSQFGDIEALSISSQTPSIGLCRYAIEDSTAQAISAFERGAVLVNDAQPVVSSIAALSTSVNCFLNVSVDKVNESLGMDFETNAVPATFSAQSPLYFKDFSVECNSSPTTVLTIGIDCR